MSTSGESTYHHGDLRRALIEAGLQLLATGGADSLGLREVARAVGVSASAPYRHFTSRQALLAAVAREGFLRFDAELRRAGDGWDRQYQLEAMGRAYIGFALDNPKLFGLMFSPVLSKESHPDLLAAAQASYQALAALADGAGTKGHRAAIVSTWALVHGLAVLLLDDQILIEGAADRDMLVEAVLARHVAGLRAIAGR